MPATTIIPLYQRHAHAWLARRNPEPSLELHWLQRFAAPLQPGHTVLDIGCGTGRPLGTWLRAQGLHVTGVDSSAAMLAHAQALHPSSAATDWVLADMRQLQLGVRFNALLAWDSFFHLTADDQRAMFAVFAAHALPGAPLMFTSGPAHGEAIGTFEGEPLYHASLAPDEYRSLLAAHGFEELAYVPEDPQCGWHTVWLARFRGCGA